MSLAIAPHTSHSGKLPRNVRHWLLAVPMMGGPQRNVENLADAIDQMDDVWQLVSTQMHEDYMYLFFVIHPRRQVVEAAQSGKGE